MLLIIMLLIILLLIIMLCNNNDGDNDYDDGDYDGYNDELAHGWRPPHGGEQAQRDNCLQLIVIFVAEFQN